MAERKAFLLRISPELWESLEAWAADELRSVNGQIEFLLAGAVRAAGRERKRHGRGGRQRDGESPD
ncbi:MAG TPA: DNA-binding protein [Candidatus Limnocylindrales bacterium]|nr:DNA-binding protein [Candidatus Limnocylindrales bacterium]